MRYFPCTCLYILILTTFASQGVDLRSDTLYELEVEVWASELRGSGMASATTQARFRTALLGQDWDADWIGGGTRLLHTFGTQSTKSNGQSSAKLSNAKPEPS